MPSLTVDFFHDVVCCWCFNISSRMRGIASEFDLTVRHRSFVLQDGRAEMAARWGSPQAARDTILSHWSACRQLSDRPGLIDIGLPPRPYRPPYPHDHRWWAA